MRARLGIAVALALLVLPAAAHAAPGRLDFSQSFVKRGHYSEGSISVVRVVDVDGEAVVERQVRQKLRFRMRRKLAPGVYRVISLQRPCNGNCELLDPPADRCARRVTIYSDGLSEVGVVVRPGRGCTMSRNALPARFPPADRISAARAFLRTRSGVNGWALIDSWGRLRGFDQTRTFVTASVVKAMLLVAYLRQIGNRMPSDSERASLGPMITVSSNDAASAIYYRVGDAALYRLAKLAGMKRFSIAGFWANARFSAEDQARFFNRIDKLVPPASRGYARGLLSSIASHQRWGFSRYAEARGFRTFFKGGWRGTGSGQLVHEAALFERKRTRLSMAVLTDGNPSHGYGTATLRGVAERIFGPARAGADSASSCSTPTARRAPPRDRSTRRTGQDDLVGTYVARRSRRNTGSPVDLTLVRSSDGKRLHMERFGFTAYLKEWWHFEHHTRPNRYIDVPLGCPRNN